MGSLYAALIRSRWVSIIATAVVGLSLALPPSGFGIPACQFKMLTHLPCFGCGLTRSFIGMAHLRPDRAVFYHPGGIPLFLLTVFLAALLPLSTERRARLGCWAEECSRPLNYFSVALLALFVVFGVGRMVFVAGLLREGRPSPW
jgi:hypothetical protein